MANSIGTLRYDIVADTSKFTKGVVATRSELALARRAFNETRTPVEQYSLALEKLDKAHESGKLETEVYRRAVDRLYDEFQKVRQPVRQLTIDQDKLNREIAEYTRMTESANRMSQKRMQALASGRMAVKEESAIVTYGKRAAMAAALYGGFRASRSIGEELQNVDELAKFARKIGTTADELQGLRLAAAEFSGMASNQLDMALQRMTRRISEAASGYGEAKDAIKELGLDAARLNAIGPAKAFEEISGAMQGVANEQDRLRLAFKLFDSEGAGLVNTLSAGSDAIQEMQRRSRELYGTLDEDAIRSIEESNDAWGEFLASIDGIQRGAGVLFAPLLKKMSAGGREIASAFHDASKTLKQFRDLIVGGGGEKPITAEPIANIAKKATIPRDVILQAIEEDAAKVREKQAERMAAIEQSRTEHARQLNREYEEQFRRQMQMAEEERRLRQQRRGVVESARDKIRQAFENIKGNKIEIGLAPSARRGSREEYQILASMQNKRGVEEAKRHQQRVEFDRRRNEILTEMRDKLRELELAESV